MTTIRMRQEIDIAGTNAVLRAAVARADQAGSRVVIAVVDRTGHVLALTRTEGAQVASDAVAIAKARTAAIFRRPSREIEEQVSSGRLGALALHGAAALTGGIPLVAAGPHGPDVVGAVGTSGETPDEDEAVSIAGASARFATRTVPALTASGARRVAAAAGAEATRRAVAPVVAVVDADGELLHLWRPDGAQVASVGVATDKARTAAIYRRPSKDFEDQAAGGRPSALHLAGAVPLQGGIPITSDGHVVGAVGVSGASSAAEDNELAVLGAAAAVDDDVVHLEARKVFDPGGIVVDTPFYKVDGGRRSGPGEVELHETTVDIMHVVQGTATVVTGDGDGKHDLAPGDVLVVPAGVPHQFTAVSPGFRYLVTKVEG